MSRPSVMRAKDGRMLCNPHRISGAPSHHYAGCEMCEAARAKGIVRPDATSVPAKLRGRRRHLDKRVDWNKVPKENRAGLVNAIWSKRIGGETCS